MMLRSKSMRWYDYYDVKVKRYPMALSLVKLHKQLKGLGERPVLGR